MGSNWLELSQDLRAVAKRVRRIHNHLVGRLHTIDNYDSVSQISTDFNVLQMDKTGLGIDESELGALCPKYQRVAWNDERRIAALEVEMNLGVSAGIKLAVVVGHIDLRQYRLGCRIDCFGIAHKRSL